MPLSLGNSPEFPARRPVSPRQNVTWPESVLLLVGRDAENKYRPSSLRGVFAVFPAEKKGRQLP